MKVNQDFTIEPFKPRKNDFAKILGEINPVIIKQEKEDT